MRVEKDELFDRSDVVSPHLVLSDRTRHICGARELDRLGPDGYLVNTARAGLVDTEALLDALYAHRIAGAALDGFDEEPPAVDAPLLRAPRTVLTPHLGFLTQDNYARWYAGAAEDLRAFARGTLVRELNAPGAGRPPHGSSPT